MSYSDLLKPRQDVLSEDGIEGIIDLANIADQKKRKLEARPADFFTLTYPTADARRVIETLNRRFSGDSDAPGLFLFEGLKGSGKSHLLLLVYQLYVTQVEAKKWLGNHSLTCVLPADAIVVINKFTDLPLYSIWDFVFERLTGSRPSQSILQPSLSAVQEVLQDRYLVLILDELEQGIRVMSDESARAQNIAFLQMLSEWGNRENRVTLFASIYSDQEEPGSTLKRVPSCRVRFEHASDKARVVLHRLFENYLSLKPELSLPVIESYLAAWRRHGGLHSDEFASRLRDSFPFSPDVLEILLDRVPARGGFQNVRGALGFLARMVKLTHGKADLMTPAHADLSDQEVAARLADLDPSGDLIRRARENLRDLNSYPLISGLGSTAMLYTLSGSGRDRGSTREELIRSVCTPATDINDFEQALLALQRYGSYFHTREGRYFFDREENADAKVEFRSLTIDPQGARSAELIKRIWREELFREAQSSVIFTDCDQTKTDVEALGTGRLRFVISPRRLSREERHLLYNGLSERNQVILLEPKDPQFNALSNKDLTKWAQRALAADELAKTPDAARRAEYERIAREERRYILDALRRAGLLYIRVEQYGTASSEDSYEEEGLGNALTREDVVTKLSQDFYPTQQITEHLLARVNDLHNRTVKDVDRDYRTILGFPVPTHATSVTRAIRQLRREGRIGVRHPRGDFSGQDPDLTENELSSATLDAPFERRPVRQPPLSGLAAVPEPPVLELRPAESAPPTPPQLGRTEEITIPPQRGAGALREQIASRLQSLGEIEVSRVRFTIFADNVFGDLTSLPQAIRGNLSGGGSVTVEISITKEKVGTKGDVERLAESLPNLPGASYSARLEIRVLGIEESEAEGA